MSTQGIQEWRVPVTGTYTIRAVGAASYDPVGFGRDISLNTILRKGEVIQILVGQRPGRSNRQNGGAGGTFVVRNQLTPIIVAGGGGGTWNRGGNNAAAEGASASFTNNGNMGGGNNRGEGGTSGGGGGSANNSAGGGGLIGNGESNRQNNTSFSVGGFSFSNGGNGGSDGGGFGGGGGGGDGNFPGGAGGGGFSGGGGGGILNGNFSNGGGGGSYGMTTLTDNGATNTGNGSVTIRLIDVIPPLAPAQQIPAQPPGQRVAVPADANGRVWGYGPRNSRTGCPVNISGFRCREDGVWLEPAFDGEWIWYFDQETNRYFHRNEMNNRRELAPQPAPTPAPQLPAPVPQPAGQETSLYPFTTHTFTTAGLMGRTGPTLEQIRTAYSGAPWAQNNQFLNMTTQGIQEWRVPQTGSYTIRAVGAGLRAPQLFGNGIDASITTTLTRGEIIRILVGQTVLFNRHNSGGAGGTFVVRGTQASPVPIIIAGGGAGRGQNNEEATSNATINNNGQRGAGVNGGMGGTNGNGGFVGSNRT